MNTHITRLLPWIAAASAGVGAAYGLQPAGGDAGGAGAPSAPADRAARWQQDIDFLASEFPRRHKNAFFRCERAEWEAAAAEIRRRAPDLSDAQIVVELRRLVALIGDGHSNIWQDAESSVPPFRLYPVACAWLDDGLFPAVLPIDLADLIGQRLVEVGGVPIQQVLDRLAELQAFDNESGRRNQVPATLREAETLAALGIVRDIDAAEFTLEDAGGHRTTITVAPIPPGANQASLVAQRPDPALVGLSRRPRRVTFGFEPLPDSRALYVWYDACADAKDKTVRQFCDETLKALDEGLAADPPRLERIVIDLRRNSGGNSLLLAPLIEGLARRPAINRRGAIFALIGRRTFSSAMMNAYQLRSATACLLVGEPTGGSPNGYGEVRQFRLPHSRLNVQYSTRLFRGPERGNSVKPDIAVGVGSAEFFDPARDPVLEAALSHRAD